MKTLILIRHAQSDWKDGKLPDPERPLSRKGQSDACLMAARIAELGLSFDRILVSPSRRTKETARLLREGGAFGEGPVHWEDRLYEASSDQLLALLGEQDGAGDRIALIGHNPALKELACRLGDRALEKLPTTAVAVLELELEAWSQIGGQTRGTTRMLLCPKDAYPPKAHAPPQPDAQQSSALARMLLDLFAPLAQTEAAVREGRDPEALHDFRVALRRSRSALRRLRRLLPPEPCARFSSELRWLAEITSELRDLDVALEQYPSRIAPLGQDARKALAPYRAHLTKLRANARKRLLRALDSPRYRELLQGWPAFLAEPGAVPGVPDLAPLAGRILKRLCRRVLRQGRAIGDDSPDEALHELRKSCKKLRYLLEFFRTLYPEKPVAGLLGKLKSLQDCLGAHQDAGVQQQKLREAGIELLASNKAGAETLLAMGQLIALQHRQKQMERERFHDLFEDFARKLESPKIKELRR